MHSTVNPTMTWKNNAPNQFPIALNLILKSKHAWLILMMQRNYPPIRCKTKNRQDGKNSRWTRYLVGWDTDSIYFHRQTRIQQQTHIKQEIQNINILSLILITIVYPNGKHKDTLRFRTCYPQLHLSFYAGFRIYAAQPSAPLLKLHNKAAHCTQTNMARLKKLRTFAA